MNSLKKSFLFVFLFFAANVFAFLPEGISYTHFILKDHTSVHVIEIDPNFFDIISAKASPKNLETVESIAKQKEAIAAINGGFFHMNGELAGHPIGILKIKDSWYGIPQLPRGAIGWSNSNHKVLFDQLLVSVSDQNFVFIIPQSNTDLTSDWANATYIVGGTPILIRSDQVISDYSSEKTIKSFLYKKHARSAIGILPNGHFVFVAVDGTRNYFFSNQGITIPDLAHFMHFLGCQEALNLDGGGSSTLYLEGEIVNVPCGENYDGNGHYVREVSDAILVLPKAFYQ